MLDKHAVSRLLTWCLMGPPVNNSMKIFVTDKLTSFGVCMVGESCNLSLELQILKNRIRRCSQNTVTQSC